MQDGSQGQRCTGLAPSINFTTDTRKVGRLQRAALFNVVVLILLAACSSQSSGEQGQSAKDELFNAHEQALDQTETSSDATESSDATAESEEGQTTEETSTDVTETPEPESGAALCYEGVGQTELSLAWAEGGEGKLRTTLQAVIHNHSREDLEAEPLLTVANRSAGSRTLQLDTVVIAAGKDASIVVPVTELPLQSSGVASAVTIGLRWRRAHLRNQELTGTHAFTRELHVAHDRDSNFGSAEVRSNEEQYAYELSALKAGERQRVSELRVRDDVSGRMQARSAAEISELPILEIVIEDNDAAGTAPVEVQP